MIAQRYFYLISLIFAFAVADPLSAQSSCLAGLTKSSKATELLSCLKNFESRVAQLETLAESNRNGLAGVSTYDDSKLASRVEKLENTQGTTAFLSEQAASAGLSVVASGLIKSSEFRDYKGSLRASVKTDLSQFETPKIFVSIKGRGFNWYVSPSIYPYRYEESLPADWDSGFDVFVYKGFGLQQTTATAVELARSYDWQIDWVVVAPED